MKLHELNIGDKFTFDSCEFTVIKHNQSYTNIQKVDDIDTAIYKLYYLASVEVF